MPRISRRKLRAMSGPALYTPAGSTEDALVAPWVAAVATAGATVSGPRRTIINTLATGLRADGLVAILDRLWLLAAATTQEAHIDLLGRVTATVSGSPTFVADTGYTGDGSTGYLNTGFTPSSAGGHYTSNSCSFGAYHINNRTTGQTAASIGSTQNSELRYSVLEPKETSPLCVYEMNGATFGTSVAISTIRHSFVCSRTTSTDTALYLDNVTTPYISTSSSNTFGLSDFPFFIMANNQEATAIHHSSDTFAAAFLGGGLTATQAVALSNRINAYVAAIGITPIW